MIDIINKMKTDKHDIKIEIEEDKNKVFFIIYIDNESTIKIEQI